MNMSRALFPGLVAVLATCGPRSCIDPGEERPVGVTGSLSHEIHVPVEKPEFARWILTGTTS